MKKSIFFKKTLIFIVFFANFSLGQENSNTPKALRSLLYYSTLEGVGIGGSYHFHRNLSLFVASGVSSPINIGWGSPYSGNRFNFGVKLNVEHPLGFYLSPGWYTGVYEIHGELDFLELSETLWISVPKVALGYKQPDPGKRQRHRRMNLELGAAINIPASYRTIITKPNQGSFVLEAKRSGSTVDLFYPFFTVLIEM